MRKLVVVLGALVVAGVGIGVYIRYANPVKPPETVDLVATRGDIDQTAVATGTLQATRTVDVGSQVSGKVKTLSVDFDSIVHKGEIIAEIDPMIFQAQVDSAQATVDRAKIALGADQQKLDEDSRNSQRAQELYSDELATEQDQQQAQLTVNEDKAVLEQDQSAVAVAQAQLVQAKVNLDHCTIRSPIDGVVLARNVDVGQTVQASANVPSLYMLTSDLTKLQLIGSMDEADIGSVRPKQDVTFTVDAFPQRTFQGVVSSVRLNPTTVSNVVTYQAVIDVQNPDLRLMPGMTANLRVHVAHVSNVVRLPVAAVRFRPTPAMFAAFHQSAPPAERLAAASSVARPQPAAAAHAVQPQAIEAAAGTGVTIDAFYAPVAMPTTQDEVWMIDAQDQLKRVPVVIGIGDGNWVQLVRGDVRPGDRLITTIVLPEADTPANLRSPFTPQRRFRGGMRQIIRR